MYFNPSFPSLSEEVEGGYICMLSSEKYVLK